MDLTEILAFSVENGLFAALFVFTFWFILTENKKREESQKELYIDLSKSLDKTKDAILAIEGKTDRIDNVQSNISQDLMEVKYILSSMETIIRSQIHTKDTSK